MKKILSIFLLFSMGLMAQTPSLPITTVNNIKINNPVRGGNGDSLLVWRGGGDKIARWIPQSDLQNSVVLDSIQQLYTYDGNANFLVVSDTVKFNQNGFFRYDVTEREVDSATVFPATGRGSGYWVRQYKGTQTAEYYPINEIVNDTTYALYDGSIIQEKHKEQIASWLSFGKKISYGIVGSSISAGVGSDVGSGSTAYGEGTGVVNLSGQVHFGLSMMRADPAFIEPNPSVYAVVKPFNNNSISGVAGNLQKIPFPIHRLTTTANPTITYNIGQYNFPFRDSLTVYYLSRSSDEAGRFDIETSLGTTTVDTYEAPNTYVDTLGVPIVVNKTYTLRSKTVPIAQSKTQNISIKNIVNEVSGEVIIAGFTTGRGVDIHNFGVSSMSLVNSYFNEIRGVSAPERMDSIYKYNPNIIAIQWIDARDTLQTGYGSTPEMYGRRLDSLVKTIRYRDPNIVVMLLNNPRPFDNDDPEESRDDIPKYNQMMRRVALANNVSYIDLQRVMGNDTILRADYIHPNGLGYRAIGDFISRSFGMGLLTAVDKGQDNFWIQNQTGATQTASARISGTIQLDNSTTSGITPKIYLPITTGSGTGGSSITATSITAGNATTLSEISFNRVGTSDYNIVLKGRSTVQNAGLTVNSSGSLTFNQTPATSAGTYDVITRNTSTGLVEKITSNTFATSASVVSTTAYVSKTASYTLTDADGVVDLTSGTATFTLPTAVGRTGKQFVVKNSGAGVLTLDTTSSQTIDGMTTKTYSTQYSGARVVSNGANWAIISLF